MVCILPSKAAAQNYCSILFKKKQVFEDKPFIMQYVKITVWYLYKIHKLSDKNINMNDI